MIARMLAIDIQAEHRAVAGKAATCLERRRGADPIVLAALAAEAGIAAEALWALIFADATFGVFLRLQILKLNLRLFVLAAFGFRWFRIHPFISIGYLFRLRVKNAPRVNTKWLARSVSIYSHWTARFTKSISPLKQPHNKRYESFSARPTAFRFSQPRLQFARARSVHVGPFQLGILEAVRVDRGGVRIGVWRV